MTVVLAAPVEAPAQTQTTIVLGRTIERRAGRADGLSAKDITWDDCVADDSLGITMLVTGPPVSLEVWAGANANCADGSTRFATSSVPSLCWQVGSVPSAVSSNLELDVRDILPHGASGAGTGTDDVCATTAATGNGRGVLTLYFVPLHGNQAAGPAASLPILYDLRSPDAPIVTAVSEGDARLFPSWSSSAESVDRGSYQIYCEPAADDPSGACVAPTLVAGQVPSMVASRATTGSEATSGVAEGLQNDVRYACGVSASDKAFNRSPLSNLVCATPRRSVSVPATGGASANTDARDLRGPEVNGRCAFSHAPLSKDTALAPLALLAALISRRLRTLSATNTKP